MFEYVSRKVSILLLYRLLQAEAREKERQREEARKQKKLDQAFLMCLQDLNVDYKLEWEEVREKILEEAAFKAITLESERVRLYKVRIVQLNSIRLKNLN